MSAFDCSKPLSTNVHLLRWVEKMATLCKPDRIHWVDGSKAEYDQLCNEMVEAGTFIKLNQKTWPGCFLRPFGRLAMSPESKIAPTFAAPPKTVRAPPTTGWIPLR
jgi:phosphoenolpyruvate carboxykinase (GTP)